MSTIEEVDRFLHQTEERFSAYCQRFNAGTQMEKRSWDSPLGDIRSMVSRGEVFEKASAVYCDIEVDTPPVLYEQMERKEKKMRALVLEIGIHPFNPHIPKSYLELRANRAGKAILAGGTDIFPYFPDRADSDLFAEKIRSTCNAHGVDYEALRKVRTDFFQSKYTKENVGAHAGIYFFQLGQDKVPFFKAMTAAFFEAYEALIEAHRGEPVRPEDKAHQQMLHGKWAQWIMVEDEGTRFGLEMGIPPEALLGAILPPVATY